MILIVLSFLVLGLLVYRFWKPIAMPPKRDVKPNEANLYFFYTNWCGFSKKAMPEWEALETKELFFGKTRVTPVAVNCETDKATCSLYGIEGYPSVLLETKSGLSQLDTRVTTSNMISFLERTLGKERRDL